MKYQVIHSASDGDDVLATFGTYEDALGKVVEVAKRNDGFLAPTQHANLWVVIDPARSSAPRFALRIAAVKV